MSVDTQVNALVAMRDMRFTFRTDKQGNKRPAVELRLAVPSAEGLVDILTNGGKPLDLLLDLVADYVRQAALDYVAADESVSQESFPHEKVEFSYLANLVREDRRSAAMTPALWEAFGEEYVNAMQAVTGKSPETLALAVSLFVKKLAPVKTAKPTLAKLKEQLSIFSETPNAEYYESIITYLVRRIDAYMAAEDDTITADLI